MEGLNGMNKKIKKMIALVTVFVSLLMVVPTFAAQPVSITAGDQVSIVHYPNKQESDEYLAYVSSTNKVKVTVANPKIGTGILYKESRGCVVYFKAKKSGTTTVTIKAGKVSKKIEVTVRNYANPLASVKVGNITVSGSKYNKSNEVDLSYVKYVGKKINITFKSSKRLESETSRLCRENIHEKCKIKEWSQIFHWWRKQIQSFGADGE